MLPNKTGLFGTILLSSTLLAAPMVAFADLTIINNTTEDSTSVINGGICSVVLGDVGTTKANHVNVVPQQTLNIACFFHPNDCKADIFMNPPPAAGQKNNCNGIPIATVTFSTVSGVLDIKMNSANLNGYRISGSGFSLTIDH